MPEELDDEEKASDEKAEALTDLRMYADLLASGINSNDILNPATLAHLGTKLMGIADILSRE